MRIAKTKGIKILILHSADEAQFLIFFFASRYWMMERHGNDFCTIIFLCEIEFIINSSL